MKKIVDLTLTVDENTITCGTPWHPSVELIAMGRVPTVGRNTTKIILGSHTATHMDAPLHFIDGTYGVDQLDLQLCCGPVSIWDMTHIDRGGVVRLCDVEGKPVSERVLLRFGWYKYWGTQTYYDRFPYLTPEAAEYLVGHGMRLLAMDTPSPDDASNIHAKDDSPIHKLLLSQNVIIVEYLTNTEELDPLKGYDIIALPLKLRGCDASPARVIVIQY